MREHCSQLTNENVLFIESLYDTAETKRPISFRLLPSWLGRFVAYSRQAAAEGFAT